MSLESLAGLEAAPHPKRLKKILTEIQGLTMSVVTGAAANTAINIAAIRDEDLIIGAFSMPDAGGALVDHSTSITIQSCKASGTITLSTVVADNTVTVNGNTYTFKVAASANAWEKVSLGVSDTAAAANLAAAINHREGQRTSGARVSATAASGVVTVKAALDGTGGNAVAMTKVGAPISLSGATLSGGTATGSIKSSVSSASSKMVVLWFNKQ
jgi:hypothetical protein